MNMRPVVLVLCLSLLASAGTAFAAPSKHEQNLQREAARLDRAAATPEGEKAVVSRLNRDFAISNDRIASLREKGLGYGEITVTLSCAQSLAGGATEENIGRVVALRQGPPVLGWGVIADQLGIKLGKCVSQVKKVHNESRRDMKKVPTANHDNAANAPAVPPRHPKHPDLSGEGKPMSRGPAAQ
ncbi:MAG: hypothetical protein OEW15_14120 [Nitrospirota bacterium]|nr:hypothetical protein [Nitrospirota bacterium]